MRKNRADASHFGWLGDLGVVTVLSLGAGMNPKPSFHVLDVSISAVSMMVPLVARIREHDRDLGEQLRRALSSVVLNISEGSGSRGGNRLARYRTAMGSNVESRAALRVAVAWGYVAATDVVDAEAMLDRVTAMLYRLGARR